MKPYFLLAAALLATTLTAAAEITPKPWLGVALTMADDQDYDRAITDGRGLGMGYTELSLAWDDLEPQPGAFRGGAEANWLAIANTYYPAIDLPVMLTLTPIDTVQRRTPDDLNAAAWDDPALIARFTRLLDHIAQQTPDLKLVGLSIGNEVDAYLGDDAEAWRAYTAFFTAARAHAQTLWPDVPIGVKLTADGLLGGTADHAQALAARGDAVMANYYPLTAAFRVATAAQIRQDLDRLLAAAGSRPLWFTELGCPSGHGCGSNEATQARFFRGFGRWRARHPGRVPKACVTWLNDIGDAEADGYTDYYGVSDAAFRAYLATLGIQRHNGSPKRAVREIRSW